MKISAISIDMFQTLIDVNDRVDYIWKAILRDEYCEELVPHYLNEYFECYDCLMETVYGTNEFINLKTIFTHVFERIKHLNKCSFVAEKAAEILIEEHTRACFFKDAEAFLNQWNNECELWLSSDADHIMIDPLLTKFKFDRKFISEDIKAYKKDKQDRFFKKIVTETNVNANEIIHVGDSLSDVIGAKRAGMKTCWINRLNATWSNQCHPDYTISNLLELQNLLQILKG